MKSLSFKEIYLAQDVKWSTYYQARLNRGDAQRERKKSHDTSRDDTSGIRQSKKLRF